MRCKLAAASLSAVGISALIVIYWRRRWLIQGTMIKAVEQTNNEEEDGDNEYGEVYEFTIPNRKEVSARLFGRRRKFLQLLAEEAGVALFLASFPQDKTRRKVILKAKMRESFQKALALIRHRFPLEEFPDITLERIN